MLSTNLDASFERASNESLGGVPSAVLCRVWSAKSARCPKNKVTIGDVILHSTTGIYFEFSGLSKWQRSGQYKTGNKEHTSTGPLRPGKYFLGSSPSPYPFGLSMCSV